MYKKTTEEATRQMTVCNACRYCESYCQVFPALQQNRIFTSQTVVQLANLCHNCRGCYYACQYTPPHEFAINLPQALAEVRQDSWQDFAWPQKFARRFHTSGFAIALVVIFSFMSIIGLMMLLGRNTGNGFYALVSHTTMVAIFLPAFLFPYISVAVSLRRYWRYIGGGKITLKACKETIANIATMKNLAGGHGQGCNFEDADKFSNARRYAHHLVLYGFLLCFASTSSATILHYVFDLSAPYPLWSIPKLLGMPGGVAMMIGCAWLMWLKRHAKPDLNDTRVNSGASGFVVLLFIVAASGIALYIFGESNQKILAALLALHLGSVLAFFVLTPYTKMVHGFYRLAALLHNQRTIDEQYYKENL